MAPAEHPGIPRRTVFLGIALAHAGAVLALMADVAPLPAPSTELVMQAGWLPAPVAAAPTTSPPRVEPVHKAQPAHPPKEPHDPPLASPAPVAAPAGSSTPSPALAMTSTSHEDTAAAPATRPGPAGKTETPTPPSFAADYLANPAPDYPRLSRDMGEEGRVELRVHVTTQGLPDEITPHRSSGHERLDRAALQAVWRWKFVPARLGHEAQAGWVIVPISFNLRK